MNSFTKKELKFLKSLKTPAKVQDYLNSIPFNFERDGVDTIKSPFRTFREKNAHCFEGALLGAFILSLNGHKPMLMHLKTTKGDYDHVVAPFKQDGFWGALSKTNHGVLRFREPVYRDIRELALSYFHEYFLDSGLKTLRSYSEVLDLSKVKENWVEDEKDLWYIDTKLDRIKHFNIVPKNLVPKLRKADRVEIEAGKIVEYNK